VPLTADLDLERGNPDVIIADLERGAPRRVNSLEY
jgi:hypothetical protein